ncbi:hypothetical protein Tco_0771339 [Tanacetum coccineum]|uniref:Uncharacterized protein n=1 Tax=Tanacetum coccineum TaxID=301880 RepID=A0ABQ4ZIW1_9ASTR
MSIHHAVIGEAYKLEITGMARKVLSLFSLMEIWDTVTHLVVRCGHSSETSYPVVNSYGDALGEIISDPRLHTRRVVQICGLYSMCLMHEDVRISWFSRCVATQYRDGSAMCRTYQNILILTLWWDREIDEDSVWWISRARHVDLYDVIVVRFSVMMRIGLRLWGTEIRVQQEEDFHMRRGHGDHTFNSTDNTEWCRWTFGEKTERRSGLLGLYVSVSNILGLMRAWIVVWDSYWRVTVGYRSNMDLEVAQLLYFSKTDLMLVLIVRLSW